VLYDTAAVVGLLLFVGGPVTALFCKGTALTAATIGYAGIAVFVGAIASRYSFITRTRPIAQLALNTALACLFTSVFYGVFLLLLLL
jgi:hypothetical protein